MEAAGGAFRPYGLWAVEALYPPIPPAATTASTHSTNHRLHPNRYGIPLALLPFVCSYSVHPGQIIGLAERLKRGRQLATWAMRGGILSPADLELDRDHMTGRRTRPPVRDEIPPPIDDRLIVELYSR